MDALSQWEAASLGKLSVPSALGALSGYGGKTKLLTVGRVVVGRLSPERQGGGVHSISSL